MSLNSSPAANRIHIGFFGKTNVGKSSLVNAITGQNLAIVSDVKGTTTDPVYKSMEILPLGPLMLVDTPGIDDTGELGKLRMNKTNKVLIKTDVAILVTDATQTLSEKELELIKLFKDKKINYIIVYNKCDLLKSPLKLKENEIDVSSTTKFHITELKEKISRLTVDDEDKYRIIGDLIKPKDFIVLVTPIDSSAPKGRLILPQQQTIRDILDSNAISVVVQVPELKTSLENFKHKPALVITDSQAYKKVNADTPLDIPLTSFSILLARNKGLLEAAVDGIAAIENLKDGDSVLIAEGCTHHRQCDDIGSVKIPNWLKDYTKKDLKIITCDGKAFPKDLSPYKVVVHCGGCMLTAKEVKYRTKCAVNQEVPITNYGIIIAYMNGILKRALEIFPNLQKKLR